MLGLRVLDVGCGPGIYVDALRKLSNVLIADGVDKDFRCPHAKVDIFSSEFQDYLGKYDVCLCLEVGEHLPAEHADYFVELLTKVAPLVIFSAAQPDQNGFGHINCQPKSFWISRFLQNNFILDERGTQQLIDFMRQGPHMGWFVNNAMVFRSYGYMYYDTIVAEETPQAERLAEFLASGALTPPQPK